MNKISSVKVFFTMNKTIDIRNQGHISGSEVGKLNFVNDSAPMHLASSVNAPVTAIFCSTVTSFGFGPLSDNSVVLETDEKLDCRPCGLHGLRECPEKHFKCAISIEKEKLLERVR